MKPQEPARWYVIVLTGAACFGGYVGMQNLVFGSPIESSMLITGAACSAAVIIGLFIMNRRNAKKHDDSVVD